MTLTDEQIIDAHTGTTYDQRVERERKRRAEEARTPRFGTSLSGRDLQVRTVGEPLHEALGPWNMPLERARKAIEAARTGGPSPSAPLESRHGAGWDARYAEAIDALDQLIAIVRPALEECRRRAATLTADLADVERQARDAADAARERLALDEQVAAGVQASEAERLAAVEASVRKQLTTTGGKKR